MFASDRTLALDIGASKIVMAEFSPLKAGGVELMGYAMQPLEVDPDSDADLPAHLVHAIRETMRAHDFRPGPVVMSVSGQMVFPRCVKLPPVAKDKVAQIVRYEAQQNVPFPIEEVVWDYQLIGTEEGGLSVMLVAVKTEIVQKLTECVAAAGLEPTIVDVSPVALYNAVRFNYPDLQGCTMVLDIGARTTDVIFIEGNHVFTRSIPVAGNAITKELMKEFEMAFTDAEQTKLSHVFVGFGGVHEEPGSSVANRVSKVARSMMTRLHAEVGRTINFYRSQQGGSQPSLVLLSGGSSVIPHTDTFLRDKLKVDVDYLNPFRSVAVGNRISSEQVGRDMQTLGQVVGLGLRRILSCPIEINLLPPELMAKKVFRRRLPYLGVAAVCLVLVLLVWGAYLYRMRLTANERLENVRTRVAELAAVNQQLDGIKNEKKVVNDRVKDLADLIGLRTKWSEIISEIHSLLPDGMWLVTVESKMDKPDSPPVGLEIRGMAFEDKVKSEQISNDLIAALKKVKHFSETVEIRRIRPVPGAEYLKEFVVDVRLK